MPTSTLVFIGAFVVIVLGGWFVINRNKKKP